jgi:hypothetical protein
MRLSHPLNGLDTCVNTVGLHYVLRVFSGAVYFVEKIRAESEGSILRSALLSERLMGTQIQDLRPPEALLDRQFEIEFTDAGVEAFTFTFG